MRELTAHAFEQRKKTLIAILDDLGSVTVEDSGADDDERILVLTAVAPGGDLPRAALFDYREVFSRTARGRWTMSAYAYEYRPGPPPSRRAYHWHDDQHHAHCVDPRYPEGDHHYRSSAVEVFWAHDRFRDLYLSESPITCQDLHPLVFDAYE